MNRKGPERPPDILIRINKYLSMCGVTSRRGAEKLIAEGRVVVNDKRVTELGVVIDEAKDVVKVDGVLAEPVEHKVYIALNKPRQVMTTLFDPFKRKTIQSYLKDLPTRVYPVGRLDYDTEGILLLTNDGDLAYRLAHPRFGVKKVYEARVVGHFQQVAADIIAKGVKLEDGAIGHGLVEILSRSGNSTKLRITLTEGRKREVKQLCKAVGHAVIQLRRLSFAGLTPHGIKIGKWRYLTSEEIEGLKKKTAL